MPRLVKAMWYIRRSMAHMVSIFSRSSRSFTGAARRCFPDLPIHASTQMAIHNATGVRFCRNQGMTRAVLARECSAAEIALAAKEGIEIEVFGHGAQCVAVSGECLFSSVVGGRSGNRGRCAQPCRLDFKSHGRGYALSLKDLTLTDRLRELEALGVASFKIEGRLKRPEYVAAAVTACRQSLAGEVPDLETLQSVFSRSGFTDGYYTARRDLTMFGTRTREDAAAAAEVLGKLSALTRNEVGRLPVDMVLTMAPGEPATLAVTDGTHRVECHNLTVVLPDVVVNPAIGSENDSYDGKWEPFKNCTNFILQGKKNPFMQSYAVSKGFTYSIV